MKTLKRIGLFLWLKLLEIGKIVVCVIIAGLIAGGIAYCLVELAQKFPILIPILTITFISIMILYIFYLVPLQENLIDWIKDNWEEVKRRIP